MTGLSPDSAPLHCFSPLSEQQISDIQTDSYVRSLCQIHAKTIESRWGRDFTHSSRLALGPAQTLYNEFRVFSGGKAPGTLRWTPTPSSAEVKERVQLYIYALSLSLFLSGPSWPVLGSMLPSHVFVSFMRQNTYCAQVSCVTWRWHRPTCYWRLV